jgi:hypothetical protein
MNSTPSTTYLASLSAAELAGSYRATWSHESKKEAFQILRDRSDAQVTDFVRMVNADRQVSGWNYDRILLNAQMMLAATELLEKRRGRKARNLQLCAAGSGDELLDLVGRMAFTNALRSASQAELDECYREETSPLSMAVIMAEYRSRNIVDLPKPPAAT